jgi:hypothetical protein
MHAQHRVDLQGGEALFLQVAGEAVVYELDKLGHRFGLERLEGPFLPVPQRQVQFVLHQDPHDPSAARREPNGSLSPVGCWPMLNRPAMASSLSAERDCAGDAALRQFVAGEARPVVRLDRVRDGRRLLVVQRVVAPHDALQLRELAHHASEQISLGELGGALGLERRRPSARARSFPRAASRAASRRAAASLL